VRRALTLLTLPILLLSAWDSVPKTRERLALWSRMREHHRVAPDAAWDGVYAGMIPYLPPRGRVGLVQVLPQGTLPQQRQYFFLQYALAPRLLIPGADEEFVIAYGPAAAHSSLLDTTKFSLVKPFDDEFAVYRRTRQ
jgi:hypothetical protein